MIRTTETFRSGGHSVGVDIFAPAEGKRPAIILLHGANGLALQPEAYDRFAAFLAEAGYVVLLVHYFDGTKVTMADTGTIPQYFLRWVRTVDDAASFAAGHPKVLPERIGLLGTSLGASLALALGAIRPGIRAIAEFYGAMPPRVAAHLREMPPVLIVHGGKDEQVPVEEAYKLERLLKKRGLSYEIKIYPEEGHVFGPASAQDSGRLARAFFDKYL